MSLNLVFFRIVEVGQDGAVVLGIVAKLFLDAEELVVLAHPFGAAQGTGLNLAGVHAHGEVSDKVVAVSPERWEMTVV